MRRGESKTSPRRLAAMERQVVALHLRAQGRTFQEIALMAKFNSRQAAHQSVNTALARILKETTTPRQVEAALDVERLDELQVPIMRAALTGDPQAITLALAVMDRRAHLLANMRANRSVREKKATC